MQKKLKYIVLTALLLVTTGEVLFASDNQIYRVRQISISDGLSQSSVTDMVKDQNGSMWIGTYNGLNRLQKEKITSFYHNSSDTLSLPSNRIVQLCCDQNNLWVLTTGGLCRYNNAGRFERFTEQINFMWAEGEQLFTAQWGGVKVYDRQANKFVEFATIDATSPNCMLLCKLDDNNLLVLVQGGRLYSINRQSGESQCLTDDRLPFGNCSAMVVDKYKNVWLGNNTNGIIKCERNGKGGYAFAQTYNVANGKLTNNRVFDLLYMNNRLSAATDGGGIVGYNSSADCFESTKYFFGGKVTAVNSIISLSEIDNYLFAGTVRAGAIEIRPATILNYVVGGNQSDLEDVSGSVATVTQDSRQRIWIGTDGNGINRIDTVNRRLVSYPSTKGKKIVSLIEVEPDRLMAAVFGEGLSMFDTRTGRLEPLTVIDPQYNSRIFNTHTVPMFYPCGDTILILGQYRLAYNKRTKVFGKIGVNTNTRLIPVDIVDSLVLGYNDNEVVIKNRFDTNNVEPIFSSNLTINAGAYDKKMKRMWMNIENQLVELNIETKSTEKYELPVKDNVHAMMMDNKGCLWIAMTRKILCYIPLQNRFIIYDDSDGVMPNEYLRSSTMTDDKGNLYLCGVNGLTIIKHTLPLQKPDDIIDIHLSSFEIDGKPAVMRKGGYRVGHNANLMQIYLAVNKRDIFKKNTFKYIIEGKNRTELQSYNESLSLPQMPSGKYDLSVSTLTNYGTWTEPVAVAQFTVLQPFYLRWPALVFYIVLSVAVAIMIVIYIKRIEKRHMEKERVAEAQKLADRKMDFMINVSHELRTPLTLMFAPLKQMINSDNYSKQQKDELDTVLKQVANMNSLVEMTLDMRNFDRDGGVIEPVLFQFDAWINDVVEQFGQAFKNKQIELSVERQEQTEMLCFDHYKCSIVLSNMLSNALKYSKSGTSVKVVTSIVKSLDKPMLRVEVVDQGIGLSGVTDHNKLFERYYQHNSRSEGYGIGLAYAKMIVEKHGGVIGAKPNSDVGSTFYFELPYIEGTNQTSCSVVDSKGADMNIDDRQVYADIHSLSVLFVDDNKDIQAMLEQCYKERFKQICFADNGLKGLEMSVELQPDVVVCDVMMPEMDGITFCRTLKTDIRISHIPVVLLTARNDKTTTLAGYKMGADAYMAKPFDPELLLAVIRNLANMCIKARNRFVQPEHLQQPENYLISNADEDFIKRLNAFINEHMADPQLDVTMIVSNMSMGRSTFYNKMKQLTGVGIINYITRLRLQRAAELLLRSEYLIGEIAFMVGFNDQKYFSKQFYSVYGTTPTKYRKGNRQE